MHMRIETANSFIHVNPNLMDKNKVWVEQISCVTLSQLAGAYRYLFSYLKIFPYLQYYSFIIYTLFPCFLLVGKKIVLYLPFSEFYLVFLFSNFLKKFFYSSYFFPPRAFSVITLPPPPSEIDPCKVLSTGK
jgi:hypothetical protein